MRLLPGEAASEQDLKRAVCRATGDAPEAVLAVRVLKRSIDARQRTVCVQLVVRAFVGEAPEEGEFPVIDYPDVSGQRPVTVVGAGPGGLFAALRLIERGMRPVVIERGKNVHERRKDIARISRDHRVDPDSNYCFGEGGAGAFSDGKLFTRSSRRRRTERILAIFCQHGASPSILSDAHPHVGTDRLPRVIERMREQILRSGGEIHFETCMETLLMHGDRVDGIRTRRGDEYRGPVILATGHSARDVYRELQRLHLPVEPKGIAAGIRLEHPQALIDRLRYHSPEGRGNFLPAAEYRFVTQVAGRGVYSFCMCPGGFVVPAASEPGQVVVNGMSPAARNSRWANAGIVVEIRPEDLADPLLRPLGRQSRPAPFATASPLAMMHFQEQMEQISLVSPHRPQTAPAQRMTDFMRQRLSDSLPDSSYTPGLLSSPLHAWMPPYLTARLEAGFRQFDSVSRGFLTGQAVMIGIETRTSSPVRIPRHSRSMQHLTVKGLFPCGEGAGYAGGIVSAAMDGENCADSVAESCGR